MMKNQKNTILKKKKDLTKDDEYIAAFEDGSVSELLTIGTIPPPEEGRYVRIFRTDKPSDIEAKLGTFRHEK